MVRAVYYACWFSRTHLQTWLMKNSWLDDLLADCEIVETPRSWIWWSAIGAISAAAANNYFLKVLNGAVIYRPNLYIILLGPPGLGKAFGINLAEGLVKGANVTRVISGRSSIQAIVLDLSRSYTKEDGKHILDSRGFIVSGELSTALIQDPMALTILTDLYDCRKEWVNLLKGDGKERLKNNYITFLAGSSEAHFRDTIPTVNVEGGLISRTLIIQEEQRYKDADLLTDDETDTLLLDELFKKYTPHLAAIGTFQGRVSPSLEAKSFFNQWRKKWREEQKSKEDKTGFLNRLPDHVLKVAMCLVLAEYDFKEGTTGLLITQRHIEIAIEKCVPLTYTAKRTIDGKGIDPLAQQTKMIIDFLLTAPNFSLKRRSLLSKGYGNYGSAVLDQILNDLLEIKWVERARVGVGNNSDWEYTLTLEALKDYTQFLESRNKKVVRVQ